MSSAQQPQQQSAPGTDTASGSGSAPEIDLTPILVLSKCIIRPYRATDAPISQQAADNPKIARYMRNTFPSPYTLAAAESWIRIATTPATTTLPPEVMVPITGSGSGSSTDAAPPPPPQLLNFAICVPAQPDDAVGTVCGGIGLKPLGDVEARTMEVGYWLAEPRWGSGIMTEAAAAFCGWAFARMPGLLRLEACVFSSNGASRRVLEKVGFVYEGVRRRAGFKRTATAGAEEGEEADGTFDMLIFGMLREECKALGL